MDITPHEGPRRPFRQGHALSNSRQERALSYSLDVNLLLYASDQGNPHYLPAVKFLESRAKDLELFCMAWSSLMAYLRISTHPSIFAHPLSPDEALSNIEKLLSLPRIRVVTEQPGFIAIYKKVTMQFPVRGNLVPDAHLAALFLQHDIRTLYTSDMDFKKFDFLHVRNPLL
jgi:toxin-antitoxin system PIN domain toxin